MIFGLMTTAEFAMHISSMPTARFVGTYGSITGGRLRMGSKTAEAFRPVTPSSLLLTHSFRRQSLPTRYRRNGTMKAKYFMLECSFANHCLPFWRLGRDRAGAY